ncbi:MAG: PilZ domain-containing protein [Treponema sp.]|nr:PilZ domain-containing protein [Treponema sp.]
MKLLLALGSDKTFENVSLFLKPLGFDLIRYRNVQKAMDNVDEIDPEGIIISAKDFPRHWKTMTRFVRCFRPKNECPIVILKGDAFPEEEINKAMALEVNGLVLESLNNPAETEKIQTLLARYVAVDDKRTNRRYRPENWNNIGFVFSHPIDEKLITGIVKTVSATGISFEPDHPGLVEDIKTNTEIHNCSLRVGEDILSPVCTVRRTDRIITLEFLSFPGAEKETLDIYLENLPLEELKARQKAAS